MSWKPQISVILPCRDGMPWLAEQLEALRNQDIDCDWELVFVDNGSIDGSAETAGSAELHTRCQLKLVVEPTRGLNRARNAGIRDAAANLIAMCDADDVASPYWLSAMHDSLRSGNRYVGGHLDLRFLNSGHVRACNGYADGLRGTWEPAPQRSAAVGATAGFHYEVWDRLGGFDEAFTYGADDTEFGIRASLLGYSAQYVPRAVMHYRLPTDMRSLHNRHRRDGAGRAHLYARFRQHGYPRRTAARELLTILHLTGMLLRWPTLSVVQKALAIRTAGGIRGRIAGSLQYRTFYP